ncbi:RNF114 [Symbiodinium sp. CCMP2456]|nr:RNF114 [Symbiodinium sp. CCMP2456]
MPWGDPNYVSRNFISHLELRHRCDYAVLTDFDVDEEAEPFASLHRLRAYRTEKRNRNSCEMRYRLLPLWASILTHVVQDFLHGQQFSSVNP